MYDGAEELRHCAARNHAVASAGSEFQERDDLSGRYRDTGYFVTNAVRSRV